jgi:hypothetical protein
MPNQDDFYAKWEGASTTPIADVLVMLCGVVGLIGGFFSLFWGIGAFTSGHTAHGWAYMSTFAGLVALNVAARTIRVLARRRH